MVSGKGIDITLEELKEYAKKVPTAKDIAKLKGEKSPVNPPRSPFVEVPMPKKTKADKGSKNKKSTKGVKTENVRKITQPNKKVVQIKVIFYQ
jgi:hypothetical protein